MNLRHSTLAQNARTNATLRLLNGGTVELHTGQRPDTISDYSPDTCLVRCAFSNPAFEDAVDGVALATAIGSAKVLQDGEATCFVTKTDAGMAVFDGEVGDEDVRRDAAMLVDNVALKVRTTFGISGLSYGPQDTE